MGFTTFVIDDDIGVLNAICRLLKSAGYSTRPFQCAQDFLAMHDSAVPGCAILDLSMPDIDGFQLQKRLKDDGVDRPIIFLTGRGDIAASVRAMRAGAVDFLTKPVDGTELLSAVERAAKQDSILRAAREQRDLIDQRLAKLTPRETEVLGYVIGGLLNKQIANKLGIVEKTIKVHRSRLLAKLEVRCVADLVRCTQLAGVEPRYL